jgi:outer membrane protein
VLVRRRRSHAQEFKAGFVNTDRIFREANPAKAAQAKLEQEFSKRERNWWIRATLKTASDKFEREAPTMSESQRSPPASAGGSGPRIPAQAP